MGAGASVRQGLVFGVSLAIIALRRDEEDEDDEDDEDMSTSDYDYEVDDDEDDYDWIAWSIESD